jgi:hypothetical protein
MSTDSDPAFEKVDRNAAPADLAVGRPDDRQLNAAPTAGVVELSIIGSASEAARATPALIGGATSPIRP